MNANGNSPSASARLQRIKTVSRIFRLLLGLYVAVLVLSAVSCVMSGLPKNPFGPQAVSYLLIHIFVEPSPMPIGFVFIELIRLGLFICGFVLVNWLFILFARGNFFAAVNVHCVRWIGLVVAADGFAVFAQQLMHREISLGPEPLIGLFVVLISWIADEGRKIQEEQELTV
jgi:hypothetical protein